MQLLNTSYRAVPRTVLEWFLYNLLSTYMYESKKGSLTDSLTDINYETLPVA